MGTGGKRDIRRSKGIINEKEDLHLENNISADPINIGSRLELFYSSKNNSQLRARLPIDGRLATRDIAGHKISSVRYVGFKLYVG